LGNRSGSIGAANAFGIRCVVHPGVAAVDYETRAGEAVVVVHSGISLVAGTDAGEMTQRTPPRHGGRRAVTEVGTCW